MEQHKKTNGKRYTLDDELPKTTFGDKKCKTNNLKQLLIIILSRSACKITEYTIKINTKNAATTQIINYFSAGLK